MSKLMKTEDFNISIADICNKFLFTSYDKTDEA